MNPNHQQAAERLATIAIREAMFYTHLPSITTTELKHCVDAMIKVTNLPQLLADQAKCRELENALECFNIYVHDLTGDAGEDEPLVVMRQYVKQLKSRITELEAEVARLREDSAILDEIQSLPYRIDIVYMRGHPKSDSKPPLRVQIRKFLDNEKPQEKP